MTVYVLMKGRWHEEETILGIFSDPDKIPRVVDASNEYHYVDKYELDVIQD